MLQGHPGSPGLPLPLPSSPCPCSLLCPPHPAALPMRTETSLPQGLSSPFTPLQKYCPQQPPLSPHATKQGCKTNAVHHSGLQTAELLLKLAGIVTVLDGQGFEFKKVSSVMIKSKLFLHIFLSLLVLYTLDPIGLCCRLCFSL